MKSKSAPVTSWMVELRIFAGRVTGLTSYRANLCHTAGLEDFDRWNHGNDFLPANARRYVEFLSEQIGVGDRSRLNRPRALPDNHHLQLRPRNLVEGLAKVQSSKTKFKVQSPKSRPWTLEYALCRMPFIRLMWADSSVGRATGF